MWPLAGLHWLTASWPAPANVLAVTTLRGVVEGADPYSGFNLAHHVNDDTQRVLQRRELLQHSLGFDDVQWLDQVHGVDVIDAQSDGKTRCADAVYTDQAGLACAVLTADCLPAVFCNRDGSEVAVAHAGWRGLCGGVLENTVRRFSARPEQLLVWLGPAIGPQAFEVGPEVRAAFVAAALAATTRAAIELCFVASPRRSGHYLADLYQLARVRLREVGVEAVSGGDYCTLSDTRFYSFRRASVTGRLATCVVMRASQP